MTRPTPLRALPALGLALLTACTGALPDSDPMPSPMGSGIEEVSRVQVPMPPPDLPEPMLRAESASLWQRGNASFFADQRAERVGDLLTIVIEIDDNAQLRNQTQRKREGQTNLGTPSLFGYGDQLGKILPGVDDDAFAGKDLIAISGGQDVTGSGSINRNETINLRVAALVVERLPNGNLVVAGRQEVKVNHELRDLRVSGIIRPEDIQRDNSIPYDKIAEARISYGGRGQLSRQQKVQYGEGVMDVILPY
ncbi:flagellar basal body L-ring protein FlgH [Litorisediminicola beolgyonensis]|uniref:Flagellar L-ring protein n=1 Tax=Litorisediminicola beolgyonensis TaxID=1173614 RepID=A0ABW3ZFQ9_9RHOB